MAFDSVSVESFLGMVDARLSFAQDCVPIGSLFMIKVDDDVQTAITSN